MTRWVAKSEIYPDPNFRPQFELRFATFSSPSLAAMSAAAVSGLTSLSIAEILPSGAM